MADVSLRQLELFAALPNFTTLLPAWWGVYGWFFGVAIAGAAYYLLSVLTPRPVAQPAA